MSPQFCVPNGNWSNFSNYTKLPLIFPHFGDNYIWRFSWWVIYDLLHYASLQKAAPWNLLLAVYRPSFLLSIMTTVSLSTTCELARSYSLFWNNGKDTHYQGVAEWESQTRHGCKGLSNHLEPYSRICGGFQRCVFCKLSAEGRKRTCGGFQREKSKGNPPVNTSAAGVRFWTSVRTWTWVQFTEVQSKVPSMAELNLRFSSGFREERLGPNVFEHEPHFIAFILLLSDQNTSDHECKNGAMWLRVHDTRRAHATGWAESQGIKCT